MSENDSGPRVLNPYSAFSGPNASPSDRDFSVTPQRVDHRHPSVASPGDPAADTADAPAADTAEDIAPDAEPVPTPATPTPRPDGTPLTPDAVGEPVVPRSALTPRSAPLAASASEGSGEVN